MKEFLLFLPLTIIYLALKSTLFASFPLPDIPLIMVFYLASRKASVEGALFAFVLGYLDDAFSGSVIGASSFALVLIYLGTHLMSMLVEFTTPVGQGRRRGRGGPHQGRCRLLCPPVLERRHLLSHARRAPGPCDRLFRPARHLGAPVAHDARHPPQVQGQRELSSSYFKDKEPREFKGRVFAATVLIGAAFFILLFRFWYLQVKEHAYYNELSLNNATRLIKAVAPRGVIYDRLGIKIAENRPGFDLYIVPEDVKDWAKTKQTLASLIEIDEATIDERLEKSKKRPPFQAVKLKEDLSWDETVKIESFKFEIPGIMLDVAPKRSYVFSEATAHLLGYLGEISEKEIKDREAEGASYSPGDLTGKYGIEKFYEKELRGVDGGKELEVDALGRKIRVVNWIPPYPGNNMKLTIDIKTQVAAWIALKDRVGAAVAMDPKTGKILAMVSTPTFDPNALSTGVSREEWRELIENPLNVMNNRAVQGQYPPASTYKPIHAAAALEEGVITPADEDILRALLLVRGKGLQGLEGRGARHHKCPQGHSRVVRHILLPGRAQARHRPACRLHEEVRLRHKDRRVDT